MFNSKLSAMGFDPLADYPLGTRQPVLARVVRATLLDSRETAAVAPGVAPMELA